MGHGLANGPWPTGHCPWPMAHGPWAMAHWPWAMGHPWGMAHGPWAMGHGEWPMANGPGPITHGRVPEQQKRTAEQVASMPHLPEANILTCQDVVGGVMMLSLACTSFGPILVPFGIAQKGVHWKNKKGAHWGYGPGTGLHK